MAPPVHVEGAPAREHVRSRAARRAAQLAAQSQLIFAHYEHRVALPWPPHFRPEGADGSVARFEGGVLPEPKYGAFRHDLLIASFHPGHRAQWTAHELCHGLVGFAYRPSAPVLFHALAAWLAELVPVSLWYFFDEADLRRCDLHRRQGPLFQSQCEACEIEALRGPRPPDAETRRRIREGRAFMDRELAAIARSRRLGGCAGTRYATVDLASDALAYARGHGRRLAAPETERWTASFFSPGQGMHGDLDALTERVIAVRDALLGERRLKPHKATRWDYAAQDVGYRLLQVRAELTDERGRALDAIVDELARDRSEHGVDVAVTQYLALAGQRARGRAKALPAAADVFAVGYRLVRGFGRSADQVAAGIASACPSTFQALGRQARATVDAFIAADAPERAPIGRRFARWLAATRDDGVADLARLEAAITHAVAPDALTRTLSGSKARGTQVTLAQHAEIVRVEHAVASAQPADVPKLKRTSPVALAVLRDADRGVDVIELPISVAEALLGSRMTARARDELGLATTDADMLMQSGLLVPVAYTCDDVALPAPHTKQAGRRPSSTRRAVRENSETARRTPKIDV